MMWRILLYLLILFFIPLGHAAFIHPLQYSGTAEQTKNLEVYIRQMVHYRYCQTPSKHNLCSPEQLRQLEYLEHKAFKQATKVKKGTAINRAIFDACAEHPNECSYQDIMMRYRQIE
ncbi:hypothetical protein [Celerinatantimonas sp. YJH-8]|uniref:hypothetical protein n=1 Tax=Celerinatantimonas sp. YJH-8 TaxID=3228714 RepID=UPI0038C3E286